MTAPARFALLSRRVITPAGMIHAAVIVEGSRIAAVVEPDALPSDLAVEDFGYSMISPGVIDAHVHINEPGRTEWEGFTTATRAAAAGGVTTLVDMPLNSSPVTTTVAALEAKRAAARGQCWVNVGFYGGLIPGNLGDLEPLIDAGVLGLKAFMCDSGLEEFPAATLADLHAAAPLLARRGIPLLVHAELTTTPAPRPRDVRSYAEYLASRPPTWEADAAEALIELCRETGCPVHLVHLANAELLPHLAAAKDEGLPLTVETCPHYLHFAAEEVPDGATQFKCAPPIREQMHRERLWAGLRQGLIDTIGSDHSPCPPAMKHLETGDLAQAWGGIASLQLTLPIVWTGAVARENGPEALALWLSEHPARLLGLAHRKGRIAAGYDADLVIWDQKPRWTVAGEQLYHRHKITPYDGVELRGQVARTYVGGTLVFDQGIFAGHPAGALIERK